MIKKHHNNKSQVQGSVKHCSAVRTRPGLASFYIVTFVTLVLSIVVLSFVKVVINDSRRTSNDDLYQSAYDSALAGVEDARVALVKYHECLKQNAEGCDIVKKYIENGYDNCDAVSKALGRIAENESKEVPIVEKTNSSSTDSNGSYSMDQAYTCVTVDINVPDYRGTLSSSSRVFLIPVRVLGNPNDVKSINVAWFSDAVKEEGRRYSAPENYTNNNDGNRVSENTSTHTQFYPASDADNSARHSYQPITVDLFQTDNSYSLGELTTNRFDGRNNLGTDHASIVLQPSDQGDHYISAEDVMKQNDKYNNFPEPVSCGNNNGEFDCFTTIQLPNTYRGEGRNKDTFLLRVESPYGNVPIDFAITLLDGNGNAIDFSGVQANVDSTGRANDLVRRVETRIDFFTDFPYPEFAIQLNPSGEANRTLTKNYYIADNCWYSNSNGAESCDNVNDKGGYNWIDY